MFTIVNPSTNETLDSAHTWFEAAAIQTELQKVWKIALIIRTPHDAV